MSTQKQQHASSAFDYQMARYAAAGYNDAQDARKDLMNRVRDVIRKKKEGIPFDEVEDEKDPSDKNYGDEYKDENLRELLEQLFEDAVVTEQEYRYILEMLDGAMMVAEIEKRYENVMGISQREPLFTEWLEHVYGVSSILTAKLLDTFGYCEDFNRVSDLWSYTGLAPGQSRERGEKLNYNPQAKTLAWNVADNLIKQGERSRYRLEFYEPYKEKQLRRMERSEDMTEAELESVKWTPPKSDGHADNRARRYLAKKFLKHYWAIARDIQGYDTPDEWVITHGGHEKRTDTFENPFYAKRVLRGDR